MLRQFACLVVALFSLALASDAQPTLRVSNATANTGEMVTINLTVDSYTDYVSLEFALNWNPAILNYVGVSNLTTGLPGFTEASSINLQQNGILNVVWFESNINPVSLPNGTNVFSVTFEVTGGPCDSTGLVIPNIEIIDEDENIAPTIVVPGFVRVPGVGCGTFNGVRIIGENKIVNSGAPVCIKFTTEGFQNIVAASYTITFNPSVIQYTGIQSIGWPDFAPGTTYSDAEAGVGILRVVWSDPNAVGISIPGGTVLYELCFNAVGTPGQMSNIGFASSPTAIEFADGNSEPVAFQGVPGKVTIDGPLEGFALILGSVEGAPGEEVCVPITVNDFDDIIALQTSINWDSTILEYLRFEAFGLPGLSESVAGPEGPANNASQAVIAWIDNNISGVSLPDGALLLRICFRIIGSCDQVSPVVFSSTPTALEVADIGGDPIDVITIDGQVLVNCEGCGATVIDIQHVCPGGELGGIDIGLIGSCQQPVTYLWSNGATTQDLTNVPPGKYVVTITAGSTFIILDTITIRVLDPLQVNSSITDATTGNDGAISITVSGGESPYTYQWSNSATTQNISNLAPGQYTVTITDANGCVFVAAFTVRDGNAIVGTVTPVTCFGTPTGGVSVTAVNCVPGPHTYQWSGTPQTTATITNLPAGTYTVTVTGAGGSTCTATFQVPQASFPISIQIDTMNETSVGNNGAIDLTVSGGQPPYTYAWSHGLPPVQDQSGLSGGVYTVTITDAYGCVVVSNILLRGNQLFVDVVGSSYSGFGVSCAGACDGEIFVMPGNAIGNVTYMWSNGRTTALNSGLCPGTYSVTVTDGTGQSTTASFELTEPNALILQLAVNCASAPGVPDGSAVAGVSGGAMPYSFRWNTGVTSPSITSVGPGRYQVTVIDDNNCEVSERLDICIEGIECFKAISVITPNGDGKNDLFVINCVYAHTNRLSIYNRYGGLEFQMADYDNSWDGRDQNGNVLSDGGYHWVLEVMYSSGIREIYKGTVSVVRSLN